MIFPFLRDKLWVPPIKSEVGVSLSASSVGGSVRYVLLTISNLYQCRSFKLLSCGTFSDGSMGELKIKCGLLPHHNNGDTDIAVSTITYECSRIHIITGNVGNARGQRWKMIHCTRIYNLRGWHWKSYHVEKWNLDRWVTHNFVVNIFRKICKAMKIC